jgi:hypothetical protein
MAKPNPTDAMSNRTASTEQTARKAAMSLSDIRHRVFDHLRRHHGELCRHWFDQIEVVGWTARTSRSS